jgi:hypothetical protein
LRRAALALVGAACALAAPARAQVCDGPARFVDFIHVEANEGGSSGGHTALRLGESVYHWQNEGDGLLRLARRDSADFLYEYSVLENRSLHVSRIAVSDAGFAELRDAYQRRWLDESVAVDGWSERRADRAVLADLLAVRRSGADPGMSSIAVAGAGFFSQSSGADGKDPALAHLRDRIARERGDGFVAARAAALRRELTDRMPEWIEQASDARAPRDDAEWTPSSGLAREIEDRVASLFALDVLAEARPPAPGALGMPPGDGYVLGGAERSAFASWAEQLEAALVRLASSERPGSGASLLVGLARLSALRRSLDEGRLVVVDAYPDAPERVAGPRLERYRALLPEVLVEARGQLRSARERFASRPASERTWSGVETAGNRALELERAVAGGDQLRLAPAPMLPSRSARLRFDPPAVRTKVLERALADAIRREDEWSERVERQFGYRLFTRNCATEIFRTTGGALGEPIAVEGSLDFIPFLSARAVRERWRVVEEHEIPSLRRRRAASGDAWGALREASPLTSSLRQAARRDSIFLWFTDDLPWLRPVLGTANLATGLGAAAVGLALAPFDEADTLAAGLRGALFSLPELGFVNIRKGAFEWVPPADRPEPDTLAPSPSALACGVAPLEGARGRPTGPLADGTEEAVDDTTTGGVAIAPAG